jgi:hypothetical protein
MRVTFAKTASPACFRLPLHTLKKGFRLDRLGYFYLSFVQELRKRKRWLSAINSKHLNRLSQSVEPITANQVIRVDKFQSGQFSQNLGVVLLCIDARSGPRRNDRKLCSKAMNSVSVGPYFKRCNKTTISGKVRYCRTNQIAEMEFEGKQPYKALNLREFVGY